MNVEMKTVRKEMNAGDLKGLIDLPDYKDNQRVEITIRPVKKKLSDAEINELLDSLTGCLKNVDKSKTLEDWRNERLAERYGLAY